MNDTKKSQYTKAQRVIELYRRIRNGIAETREKEAEVLGVSSESIKKYIQELRDIWGADIIYKNKRYILVNEGYLGILKNTYPITAYDAVIIMTTLMQASPFIETKIEIIKSALLSILLKEDVALFKRIFIQERDTFTRETSQIEWNMQAIVQAISKGKLLSITYKHANGEIDTYTYVPYTMAYDLGKYYLIAQRYDKDTIKHLRLDRIKLITVKDEKAPKIASIDITSYLKKTWYMYTGEETKVRVKFKNKCKNVACERKINEGYMITQGKDYFIYEFICNGTQGIKLWLMGFGADAEILEPIELRNEIINDVKKMLTVYQSE